MEVSNFPAKNKNKKCFPGSQKQFSSLAIIFNLKKPINIVVSICNTEPALNKNHLPTLKISDILTDRLAAGQELVKIL